MIRKILGIYCVLLIAASNSGFCNNVAIDLKTRMDKINSFYANFNYKIINNKGFVLQEGLGELWVKRPNFFNWHIIKPEDNTIISDGKTLWFYNSVVNQVTINWLKDMVDDSPFMSIIKNNLDYWRQCNIKKSGNIFTLTPKYVSNIKTFKIKIDQDGVIYRICIMGKDNQSIRYELNCNKNIKVNLSNFTFTYKYGVAVDDQRNY